VGLRFTQSTVYQPSPLPALASLITVPDDGHGGLKYGPHFYISSNPDPPKQFYSPAEDLLAVLFVTDTYGFGSVPFSFSLTPLAHLLVCASCIGDVGDGELWICGTVSGNVSSA
jgi:hypothetical protein